MGSLSQSTFLCPACEQEKDATELHKASRLRFILCKSCAAIGRYCPACETYKLRSEFGTDSHHPNRGVTYCKPCKRDRDSKEHDPMKSRAHKLKVRFNRTQAEYDEMFQSQGGVCAICKKPETAMDNTGKRVRALAVDHDHETGAIRGLLCGFCNYLLGYVKDDAELLQAANEYLSKNDRMPHEWPEGGRLL